MKLKSALIATAAALFLASAAQADSKVSLSGGYGRSATLELGQVVSEGNGTISVYAFDRNKRGDLLGSENVHAGVNYDVHVNVGTRPTTDVIAILTVDGRVVATQNYNIARL